MGYETSPTADAKYDENIIRSQGIPVLQTAITGE